MTTGTIKGSKLPDDHIRQIMLGYFYDRNKNAASRRGKTNGAAVPISVLRADLKASHGLTIQQIHGNLTYLLSQGWVDDQPVTKSFTTSKGGIVPSPTSYFIITAAGIDKICGPSEFTRDRFQGIKIEATGQNIITLGDGNQVNSRHQEAGEALSKLREAIKASHSLDENKKIDLVVDVDSIQDQLAKPNPNKTVIQSLWDGINRAASIAELTDAVTKITPFIASLLS